MKLSLIKSAQKELDKLPDKIALRISKKILDLAQNPYIQGNKLEGSESYRARIGKYRVVYTIDKNNKEILIIKIGHRREIYR